MLKKSNVMLTAILACSLILLPIQAAEAAPAKFKNCTELNKVYPGGVAKDANVRNKGGKTKYKPAVAPAVYKAHNKMDHDKDGIACER